MTWIVGGMTQFGYGVIISDIRVMLRDGTKIDCLQKVYPVGDFIIAGFAGSVKIGFNLIENLRVFLHLNNADEAWLPKWVAMKWYRRAQWIFKNSDIDEQKIKSSILLVGIHPSHNSGDSPWATGTTCLLESPGFEPKFANDYNLLSAGTGGAVEFYKERLRKCTDKHSRIHLMQDEVAMPGGYAHAIKLYMTEAMNKHHEPTVSRHLQIAIARRGTLSIDNNDHIRTIKGQPVPFKMPWVAKSYSEFKDYCENKRSNRALATC